jgi:hypothetical protein
VLTRLRQRLARWIALVVTALTLGRVDVNASGRATTTSNDWKREEAMSRPRDDR